MAKSALFILAALAVIASTFASIKNVCNLASCNGKPHTLCRYPDGPSRACGTVGNTVLSDSDKNLILDLHNKLRRKVASGMEPRGRPGPQPRGKIGPLTWDDDLATIALRWAEQCSFGHDQCRNTDDYYVGQNVASKSSTGGYPSNYADLVMMWYDEVKDYGRNQVSNFQSQSRPMIGHYTQMVWAETTKVGCAAVQYKNDATWYSTYLVCNYGPGGNIYGSPVYKTY